jgi:hypothetical protein
LFSFQAAINRASGEEEKCILEGFKNTFAKAKEHILTTEARTVSYYLQGIS